MSESIVQKKTARLIQQELSELLGRNYPGIEATILTVSVVRISPDLGLAKVFISVLPDALLEETVRFLNEEVYEVRHRLSQRIRNKMRRVPDLMFHMDDSFREADRINKLMDELEIPTGQEGEETD